MNKKGSAAKFLLVAIATLAMAAGSLTLALADDHHHDRDRDRDGRPGYGWVDHRERDTYRDGYWDGRRDAHRDYRRDRYWRPEFHGYVPHERVYVSLRNHGYANWAGAPYWYRDRYVVRTYDRWGRPVFVEVNPYTADYVGVVRF